MKYPIIYSTAGYPEIRIDLKDGPQCENNDCFFPSTRHVTEHSIWYAGYSGPECIDFCELHTDYALPGVVEEGDQGEIGTATLWNGKPTPLRVVLGNFEPNKLLWQVQIRVGSSWESTMTGWYKTRTAALMGFVHRWNDPILSGDELMVLSVVYHTRKEARRQEKKAVEDAERKAREDEYQRIQTFWVAAEGNARKLNGRRKEIYQRLDAVGMDPILKEVPATVFGDLALHSSNSKYLRNRFCVTHVPSGYGIGDGFATQIEARMAIYLLLNSGVDWSIVGGGRKLNSAERDVIKAILKAVVNRQVPEYTKVEEVA